MRRPLSPLLLALLAGSLVACGGETGTPADTTPTTDTVADAPTTAEGSGTFPVTVPHQFGETTIEAEPQRVVTVGLTEQDILLQMGVVPVGVTEWYGDQPSATWPWAHDLLGGAEPVVLSDDDGLELERIASLEPDLIIGTNAGLERKDYEQLSAIAPTVTSVEGSGAYFSDWRDQVLQVARALGREAEGRQIVDDVDARYAAVAAEHPEWAGMTATFSQGAAYDGIFYAYQDGLNTDFLSDLGFSITPGLEEYSPDPENGFQAEISVENVDLLEADVVVWATESDDMLAELLDTGTVADLPAVAENRSVYTDGTLAGAVYFLTPLSLEYTLDRLVPALEQATAGTAPRETSG